MTASTFPEWRRRAEADPGYWVDRAILRVAEEVFVALERSGISRAELARRLGTSPAYVTKLLRGNANFTVATLARVAHALGCELELRMAPRAVVGSRRGRRSAPVE